MSRSLQVGHRLAPTGTNHDFSRHDHNYDDQECLGLDGDAREEGPAEEYSGARGSHFRRLRS